MRTRRKHTIRIASVVAFAWLVAAPAAQAQGDPVTVADTYDPVGVGPGAGGSLTATLGGVLRPAFQPSTASFHIEYGPTTDYGTSVPVPDDPLACPFVATGSPSCEGSRQITGLAPNTIYHYRFVAVADGQTAAGDDKTLFAGPPRNEGAPQVSGDAVVGRTLSATEGGWSTSGPATTNRGWLRCDASGAACQGIAGATSGTYVVVAADAGHTLRATVTYTDPAWGAVTGTSAATGVVPGAGPGPGPGPGPGTGGGAPGDSAEPPSGVGVGLAGSIKVAAAAARVTSRLPVRISAELAGARPTRVTWTVGGVERADCLPDASQVTLVLPRPGKALVVATSHYADGTIARAALVVEIAKATKRESKRTPTLAAEHAFAVCEVPTETIQEQVASGRLDTLGRLLGCQAPKSVQWGLVDARGCFTNERDRNALPDDERGTIATVERLADDVARAGRRLTARASARRSPIDSFPSLVNLDVGVLNHYYVATAKTRINGLDITPAPGAAVVIAPNVGLLVSSDAKITVDSPVGEILLQRRGPIFAGVDIDGTTAPGKAVPLADFNLAKALPLIGDSLPVKGTLRAGLVRHRTELEGKFSLPLGIFSLGDQPLEASATLTADNDSGLRADGFELKVPDLDFGALRLFGLQARYRRQVLPGVDPAYPNGARNAIDFGANARFGLSGAGPTIHFSPPTGSAETSRNKTDYGIHLADGRLQAAGAGVQLPANGIPIGPGVNLSYLGASFGLRPTRASMQASLKVLEIADVDGHGFAVIANGRDSYKLRDDDVPPGWKNVLPMPTFTSPVVGLRGSSSIHFAGLRMDFAELGVVLNRDRMFMLGGTGGDVLGLYRYGLTLHGAAQLPSAGRKGAFDVGVAGGISVPSEPLLGFQGSITGKGLVGTRGIYLCGNAKLKNVLKDVSVGGWLGHRWSDGAIGPSSLHLGECGDMGPYRSVAQLRAAGAPSAFTVAAGLPRSQVLLKGRGGAPDPVLTAPDGKTYSADAPSENVVFLRAGKTEETVVFLEKPAAGRWMVGAREGSAEVIAMQQAEGLPPAAPRAKVTASGAAQVVTYRYTAAAGRKLELLDRGPAATHTIGTVTRAAGTVRFRPVRGPAGRHTVVARVVQDGVPTAETVVARFRTAAPPPPARPARLRLRRSGRTLTASWRSVRDAKRYLVTVATSGGERTAREVRRSRTRFADVPPSVAVRVTVRAIDADGRRGPLRSARAKRTTSNWGLRFPAIR